MRLSSIDPVSLKTVKVLADAPYVVEGMGRNALVIFFENEANKAAYLDLPWHSERHEASETPDGVQIGRSSQRHKLRQNDLSCGAVQ